MGKHSMKLPKQDLPKWDRSKEVPSGLSTDEYYIENNQIRRKMPKIHGKKKDRLYFRSVMQRKLGITTSSPIGAAALSRAIADVVLNSKEEPKSNLAPRAE